MADKSANKKGWIKKALIAILFIILLGGGAYLYIMNETFDDTASLKSAYTVNAQDLINAFKLNVSSQKAKIAMNQAMTNLEDQEEKTQAEVQQKLNDYQLAIQTLNVSEQNMNLAMSIEEKNSIKFFEGIASSFELRQAQLQLLDSQQKYLNSVLQLISIKTELETLYNNTN